MKQTKPNSTRRPRPAPAVAALNAARRARGITLAQIAAEAGKTARARGDLDEPSRPLNKSTVSLVFSGISKSQNVLDATRRLIAAHDAKAAVA
jgi:hypothetical protein